MGKNKCPFEAEITDPKIDKNNVATIKWKSNAEEKRDKFL